jgi:hypothetical protein
MKAVSPLADFSYDYQDLLFTPAETRKWSPPARWLLGAALLTTGANGTCAMGNVTAPPGSSGLIG